MILNINKCKSSQIISPMKSLINITVTGILMQQRGFRYSDLTTFRSDVVHVHTYVILVVAIANYVYYWVIPYEVIKSELPHHFIWVYNFNIRYIFM